MQILVLGRNGQLGWESERALSCLGTLTALDYPEVDLLKIDRAVETIKKINPKIIVNATAYTAVDKAEDEPEKALKLNYEAPLALAQIAKDLHAVLIHYSTDYVFDGEKNEAYTELDKPAPLNLYGKSKLMGEEAVQQITGAHLIIRTSWLYSLRGESFVKKVMNWGRTQKRIRIVSDQIGCPTWARLLSEATALLISKSHSDCYGWFLEYGGLYHLAGAGSASRFEWAKSIIELDPNPEQLVVEEILSAQTEDFPTRAKRPLKTIMNSDKFKNAFGISLPNWSLSLKMAMDF
jgi:dTDP-4-dehydrorhamnose reductase